MLEETSPRACKMISESLINYSLLEIIHHVMGNGLATISGYTQLLEHVIHSEPQEDSTDPKRGWAKNKQRCDLYLQAMQSTETRLNTFLSRLRDLSANLDKEHFSARFVKNNLSLLVEEITNQLRPLYERDVWHLELSATPCYIMCDSQWLIFALEHILMHLTTNHARTVPVDVKVMLCQDAAYALHEARVAIHIHDTLMARRSKSTELFEVWSQTLDERDQNICTALCYKVIREHGGHLWSEQDSSEQEIIYVSFPLAE
ncbi:hypothetical protein KSC_042450 [Ktedonobacter sp. SOSP1-52]|uniref:HAMP domain-containing histidine kinase n=1 Tax=Ktedonobacter sp. SOSP1-52 TaxID=2778366 RepID=UPI0019156D5E|nr:HAMP domain-containing histidine kinase [Ktedonobacter sp. SOSP1-52]GHO65353.1 hypothetical protein KSC_042450 [Ktedonobacter sp. SOSP1-52]